MTTAGPTLPPMRVVAWLVVVTGEVGGISVRFHHGPFADEPRAKAAAERWQAGFIRAGKHYAVTHMPMFGRTAADRDGTWQTAEAAIGRAMQVRNTTHVEKESP